MRCERVRFVHGTPNYDEIVDVDIDDIVVARENIVDCLNNLGLDLMSLELRTKNPERNRNLFIVDLGHHWVYFNQPYQWLVTIAPGPSRNARSYRMDQNQTSDLSSSNDRLINNCIIPHLRETNLELEMIWVRESVSNTPFRNHLVPIQFVFQNLKGVRQQSYTISPDFASDYSGGVDCWWVTAPDGSRYEICSG